MGEPSPLIFHLAAALAAYQQALFAAPRADAPQFPWDATVADAAAELGSELSQIEIAREGAARLSAMLRGLELWQRHPYRRTLAEPPVIWAEGTTRLLDFGAAPEASDPDGPPVLVVPSLINRAYIVDLAPGRSLMRWLAAEGFRPALLDWGTPGRRELRMDLDDYGRTRLMPALAALRASAGRKVAVVGYCMGGTLSAGLAARAPEAIAALATIGAPWDFASPHGIAGGLRTLMRARGVAQAEALIDAQAEAFGLVPVLFFQSLFALINPIQAAVKFQRFARLDQNGATARTFVALEDWLADGVPMPGPAAKNLLIDWQMRNATVRGEWRFLGGPVRAHAISVPSACFCGTRDSIAPPALAEALPRAIPGAQLVRPRTGHVGMIVGGLARSEVWRPLARFLREHGG